VIFFPVILSSRAYAQYPPELSPVPCKHYLQGIKNLHKDHKEQPAGLLGFFKGIEKKLHPGFFSGCGVFFDNSLTGGGIDLFNHILQRRFRFVNFLFPGQHNKFLCAGPDGAFYRLVPEPPFLTLPVTLFGGTALNCQKKTPTLL
jgi:hypothetical protein